MSSQAFFKAKANKRESKQIPSESNHEAVSNIIFNLSQMGISIRDAFFIEIDTYFELLDLFKESMGLDEDGSRTATQTDIDRFLL